MQTCTLAVDIGASSGRHIAGTVQNGKITLQEVYRFENGVHRENGHLCWDIDTLAQEVVNGLKAAHDAGFAPATIGIDTWAVDFVLLDADNKRIGDAVAYRDERTEGIREALEKEYGLTFADHYARTGIQYQPFNTVYQLMALKKEHPEQLAAVKVVLVLHRTIWNAVQDKIAGGAISGPNEFTKFVLAVGVGTHISDEAHLELQSLVYLGMLMNVEQTYYLTAPVDASGFLRLGRPCVVPDLNGLQARGGADVEG
jgi:hypothetical protein